MDYDAIVYQNSRILFSKASMKLEDMFGKDTEFQKQFLQSLIVKTYENFKLLKERCTATGRMVA